MLPGSLKIKSHRNIKNVIAAGHFSLMQTILQSVRNVFVSNDMETWLLFCSVWNSYDRTNDLSGWVRDILQRVNVFSSSFTSHL